MAATITTVVLAVALLVLVTRAAGMIRGRRLGVAGMETSSERDVQPALLGIAMGVLALLFLGLFYFGVTHQAPWHANLQPGASGATPAQVRSPGPVPPR